VKVAVASAPRSEPSRAAAQGRPPLGRRALADRDAFETLVGRRARLLRRDAHQPLRRGDGALVTPPVHCGLVPGRARRGPARRAGARLARRRAAGRSRRPQAGGAAAHRRQVGVASVAECDGRPLELAASGRSRVVSGKRSGAHPRAGAHDWTDRPAR
jgi:hypothetical protein